VFAAVSGVIANGDKPAQAQRYTNNLDRDIINVVCSTNWYCLQAVLCHDSRHETAWARGHTLLHA